MTYPSNSAAKKSAGSGRGNVDERIESARWSHRQTAKSSERDGTASIPLPRKIAHDRQPKRGEMVPRCLQDGLSFDQDKGESAGHVWKQHVGPNDTPARHVPSPISTNSIYVTSGPHYTSSMPRKRTTPYTIKPQDHLCQLTFRRPTKIYASQPSISPSIHYERAISLSLSLPASHPIYTNATSCDFPTPPTTMRVAVHHLLSALAPQVPNAHRSMSKTPQYSLLL